MSEPVFCAEKGEDDDINDCLYLAGSGQADKVAQ
jgi:hypothetical protein